MLKPWTTVLRPVVASVLLWGGVQTARASLQPEREATTSGALARQPKRQLRPTDPVTELGTERLERAPKPLPESLVAVPRPLPIRERPGRGARVGVMPAGSPTFDVPTVAWILDTTDDGRFGKVTIPYSTGRASGWIPIRDLGRRTTPYVVRADISERELTVTRWGRVVMRFPVAVGSATSPTPPGRYFVTDRVPFDPGGPLGAFAFGISGVQPNLPPGWYGADQLAVHGTNDPSSIGRAATAGCLRVTNRALERLKPVVGLGTPVVFER